MADPKFFFEFFLIAIHATGVVAWTSDESCLNGEENLSIVDRILWNTRCFSGYFWIRVLLPNLI